jgi:hypothetical protein
MASPNSSVEEQSRTRFSSGHIRVKAQKGPVDFLVIDSVEKVTAGN